MRPATVSDRNALEELVALGLTELASGRGGSAYVADLAHHLQTVEEDLANVVVDSIIDHGIVAEHGFGVANIGLALIFVHPNSRRRRIGSSLYEALRASGSIEVWAKPGDRTAKSFAESLGLKARLLIMSAEQGPSDAE